MTDFLAETSLLSETDSEDGVTDCVTLMTIHSARALNSTPSLWQAPKRSCCRRKNAARQPKSRRSDALCRGHYPRC